MNTQYIFFEKSIAVKTPGRFCSGLQNEVIFEKYSKTDSKIVQQFSFITTSIEVRYRVIETA